MPGTPTTKWGLVPSAGTDQAMTIDNQQATTYAVIDGLLTPWSTGVLSARPVSTVGSPGKAGRRYFATDVGVFGCEYVDLGTSWRPTSDHVKLNEITLGSIGAIDFTSIPQAFKTLRVLGTVDSSRSIGGAPSCGVGMRVNNDSAANYNAGATTTTTNSAGPATTAPGQLLNATVGFAGQQNGNNPATPATIVDILIPRYSVTGNKLWTFKSTQAATGIGVIFADGGGAYFGSTAAVTRLTFSDDNAMGLVAGSSLALYGIV